MRNRLRDMLWEGGKDLSQLFKDDGEKAYKEIRKGDYGDYWAFLHIAVWRHCWPAYQQLLDAGASLWDTTRYGLSAFHYTVLFGTTDMMRAAVVALQPRDMSFSTLFEDVGGNGDNLINMAIRFGGDEYCPDWSFEEYGSDDEAEAEAEDPEDVVAAQTMPHVRSANMDMVLAHTLHLWTPLQLQHMWDAPMMAAYVDEVRVMLEVMDTVQCWQRWNTMRREWVTAVIQSTHLRR
jgi:hypothetical protein